MSVVPLTLHQM